MTLVYIAIFGFALVLVLHFGVYLHRNQMIRRKIYPQKGMETMADVARLAKTGHSSLAAHCYRQITKSSLKDAVAAVKNLRTEQ